MCSQNAGNGISETQILKISWGMPPRPPSTRLTPSAIAYYPGGRARKMGPLAAGFAPPLKNP
jgi:hypothetical protein